MTSQLPVAVRLYKRTVLRLAAPEAKPTATRQARAGLSSDRAYKHQSNGWKTSPANKNQPSGNTILTLFGFHWAAPGHR